MAEHACVQLSWLGVHMRPISTYAIFAVGLGALIVMSDAGHAADPATRDQCGPGQRVPLPGCAPAAIQRHGVHIVNRCSYDIYVKVDIRNFPDTGGRLRAGFNATYGAWVPGTSIRGVYCCPRYSRCR
jgi:hypothetical protein